MKNLKTNSKNKLKVIVVAVCIFLIAASFSSSGQIPPILNSTSEEDKIVKNPEEMPPNLEKSKKTEIQLLISDNSGLTIENRIDIDDLIIETSLDSDIYHIVALPDYFFTTEIGKPQIPVKTVMVAIPESVDISIEILSSSCTTISGYSILSVPEKIETVSPEGYTYFNEVFTMDEEFYSQDVFYPNTLVEIESISHIRDLRVARLSFHPIQYNPATRELQVYSSIKGKISYSQNVEFEIGDVGPFDSICSNLLLNYESSKATSVGQSKNGGNVSYPSNLSDPNNSADYLIITSNEFYIPAKQDFENGTLNNRLNELAHWRATYNGFDVAVVNVNDSFIGGNNDTYIKNFTAYVYNNWSAPHMSDDHVGYILLVGDTPYVTSHAIYEGGVSDGWYVCLDDDSFPYDSLPDIMIGRFSVDDYSELDTIADKTIQYEQNPVEGDWHRKVLLAGGTSDSFFYYSFIKEILLELGGYEVFKAFKSEGDTIGDVINNINDGRIIVAYEGHGSPMGWCGFFGSAQIDQLTNGYKLPIIFSITCQTGSFQCHYDCFGEKFLNADDKGAVAFYGASCNTYGRPFMYYAFRSIFENFEYVIGKIINEAVIQMGYHPEFNLFGDPALDISGRTRYPDKPDLAISHLNITIDPDTPTTDDEEITITADILNIGGNTAENVNVRFIVEHYGEQYIIGEQTISEITPGNQSTLIHRWNTSEEFGTRFLIVQIDPLDNIDEGFELNNQAGVKVTFTRTNLSDVTYVDDDYDNTTQGWGYNCFSHIQDGIDAVARHGTVIVHPGIYYENVVIEKPLTLLGEDKNSTIVDGGGRGNVFSVSSNWVTISGFTIQNSGKGIGVGWLKAGIWIERSEGSVISGNTIKDNKDHGIYVVTSLNNVISGNTIANNSNSGSIFSSGVRIISSRNIDIIGNTLNNNSNYVITIEKSENINIIGNIITNNFKYGIVSQRSLETPTRKILISGNIILNNGIGMYLGGENFFNSTIKENIVINNSLWGIYLPGGEMSYGNVFYHNYLNNIRNAHDTCSDIWDDGYPSGGNYWSDFHNESQGAYDNNSDGIVDSPYNLHGGDNQDRYPLSIFGLYLDAYGPYYGWVNKPIKFISTIIGGSSPYLYEWDFNGDGAIDATGSHPAYTYDTAGNYTMTLSVTDNEGDVVNDTVNVTVKEEVVAYANGPYDGVTYEPVEFIGCATGGHPPYTFEWDFNSDGFTDGYGSPAFYTFGTVGNYLVTLTVIDSRGYTAVNTTSVHITMHPLEVEAGGPYIDTVNISIQFNGYARYGFPPYSWFWDFGDGNTSQGQNTTHIYTSPSIYIATLTVTDIKGNSSNDTASVHIFGDKVKANANGPYRGIVNGTIWFFGSATGGYPYYFYHWDFGDGNTSDEQNPTHTYNAIGNYTVVLTATDIKGNTDSDITTATIIESVNIVYIDDDFNETTEGWQYDHFDNIQDGIDVTADGGTVIVYSGMYDTPYLIVYKDISIFGENKDTTIIDGNGTGENYFVTINDVTISGFTIKNCLVGIYLLNSENVTISDVNFSNNFVGLFIGSSTNNTILRNTFTDNYYGMYIESSSDNSFCANNITHGNEVGIIFAYSNDNIIYHNNFIDNTEHVSLYSSTNSWDNGYPSGGNYWDDYNGIDMFSGPGQNISGSDGIGDTPYNISVGGNQDHYPLMEPWDNHPPNKPTRPSGPIKAVVGRGFTYFSSTNDPDGDIIYYLFDWGDGTDSGWVGPFDGGLNSIASVKHIWIKAGAFEIKVKSKDIHNDESDWSDPLVVRVFKPTPLPIDDFLEEDIPPN